MIDNIDRLPYPGLRAFNRDEADLFFGRDSAVNELILRLSQTRFLAVLGASGTGKSSLVRTGMLDGLELGLHPAGANWRFCDVSPGGQPIRSLARGLLQVSAEDEGRDAILEDDVESLEWFLRRGPRSLIEWLNERHLPSDVQLLFLVDQFEELFRFGEYDDREEAEAFVQLLIYASLDQGERMHVVITMRSEFLGACVLIPDLAETINAGTYLAPRMDRDGCRKAIVGPARMFGKDIEPALVNRLLNDLATFAPFDEEGTRNQLRALSRRADQLPVMQHVLNRIWREEVVSGQAEQLSFDTYERLGGMRGALNQHGEEVLTQIGPDKLSACEKIFRALVDGNSIITASRRPIGLANLARETGLPVVEVRAIVDVFRSEAVNFLRPPPSVPLAEDSVIDISHESLIRQWSKLSEWMQHEASAAAVIRRVSDAMDRYESGEGDHLSGLDLANITSWWEQDRPTADWGQRYTQDFEGLASYLQKSQSIAAASQQERSAKEAREKRTLRVFTGATSVIAIAAAFFFFDAREKRFEADTLRAEAQTGEAQLLAITEALVVDLVERLDTDDTIPITAKFGLIRATEDAFAALAESQKEKAKFVEQRATFLLASLDALRTGGFWKEAEEYALQLEAILLEKPAGWKPSSLLMIRSSVALVEYYRVYARLDNADLWLERARELNELSDPESPGYLTRKAQIYLSDIRIANQWHLHERLLNTANEIWMLFDEQMAIFESPSANRLSAGDPDAFDQRRHALAELAYTVVITNSSAASSVKSIDADTRFGVDYPQLESVAQAAFDFLKDTDGFDKAKRSFAEIKLISMKARAANDNDLKSLRAVELMDNSIQIAENLSAQDPTNRRYRVELLWAIIFRANYAIATNQLGQAGRDLSASHDLLLELRGDGLTWSERLYLEPWLRYYVWQYVVAREWPGETELIARQELRDSIASVGYNPTHDTRLTAQSKMLGAYVDLEMWLRDKIEYQEIKDNIQAAMDAHPARDNSAESAYFNLAQRQFLHYQLVQAGTKRLAWDDWNRARTNATKEASKLIEFAPGEYRWINNQMIYQWFSAWVASNKDRPEEANELYRDAFARAVKSASVEGIREREYLGAIANSINIMLTIIGFGEEHLDDADMARLNEFLETHVSDPDKAASVTENTDLLDKLVREIDKLSETMGALESDSAQSLSDRLQDTSRVITQSIERAVVTVAAKTEAVREAARDVSGATIRNQLRNVKMEGIEGEAIFWVRPPLFSAIWHTLEGDAFSAMLDAITAGQPELNLSEVSYIRSTKLSFYDDGYLVEMQLGAGDQAPLFAFLVTNGTNVYRLSGKSPAIHEANATTPIVLDRPEKVAAYIRLFTHYVNADEGSFSIVENTSDIPFAATAQREEYDRAQAVMRPFAVWRHPEKPELWQSSGTVYYGRALFHAIFEVQQTGMIEMVNDNPVITDLEASLMRISDREAGVRLNGEEAGRSINFERIGLARHETRMERIETAIRSSLALPDAEGRTVRLDYIGFLLNDLYKEEASEHVQDRNGVAYELLLADVDHDIALELSELVRRDAPDNPYYSDTYGWALLKLGQTDKAVAILEQSHAGDPEHVEIMSHLAQAYRIAGRIEDAHQMLGNAEAFAPDSYWAEFIRKERLLLAN